MSLLVLVVSDDRYLSATLSDIMAEEKLRQIRTADLERITRELKKPDRVVIIDMKWEPIQERGVLRQLINISRITDGKVVCICPNDDENLKKMAKNARPSEVFLRYDLTGAFREYLKSIQVQS